MTTTTTPASVITESAEAPPDGEIDSNPISYVPEPAAKARRERKPRKEATDADPAAEPPAAEPPAAEAPARKARPIKPNYYSQPEGRAAVETQPCPACKSKKGAKCSNKAGEPSAYVHPARYAKWEKAGSPPRPAA